MFICSRWLVALGLLLLATCLPAEELFTRVHPAMGTDFTLYIYAADATFTTSRRSIPSLP